MRIERLAFNARCEDPALAVQDPASLRLNEHVHPHAPGLVRQPVRLRAELEIPKPDEQERKPHQHPEGRNPNSERRVEQPPAAASLNHQPRPGGSDRPIRMSDRNASLGTSTAPIIFIFFLPSLCFSRSFRLRVMSPRSEEHT